MENNKLGQEPAFASQPIRENGQFIDMGSTGMSKRFYAACAAMQGLCVGKTAAEIKMGSCADIAELSFMIADELLKQESNE